MKKILMKIDEIKFLIKNNPAALIRKPCMVLYLPLIGTRVFLNNCKISVDKVYFVETKTDDYLKYNCHLLKNGLDTEQYNVINIKDYADFTPILNLRLAEDFTAGIEYQLIIQKRFSNDSEAFVIIHEEKPAGYIFIQKNETRIAQVKMNLPMPYNTFTFIDLYIFKEYRGMRYHEILYTAAIERLTKLGYNSFWCWLMEHNQISIKVHVKIGISNVTKIITRKCFLFFSCTKIENKQINLSSLIKNVV